MEYENPQGSRTADFRLALEIRALDYYRAVTPQARAEAFRRWLQTLRNIADANGEFAPIPPPYDVAPSARTKPC